MLVGITHSSYRPIDNRFVIEEEFEVLVAKATAITDPFEQAFFLLVHLPYLQTFADANQRTSRIASNIPLLKADLAPMSFLTMDDRAYVEGLIGVYELNDVSLLREVFVDAYLASAENYRVLRADLESPHKAAPAYRDFVRTAVRQSVLEWKTFRPDDVKAMAVEAGIPEADRQGVVDYVGNEIRGLHEGNAIRYRLRPEDHVLAKDCLERAARLDPESVLTRTMLAGVVSSERRHATWALLRGEGPVDQYEALAALPAQERFETMAQAAVDSLVAVRGATGTNDRNMAGYIDVKADNARRFAQEVRTLSASLPDLPDAGVFVYQAHMTLASLEMLDGDTAGAVESLRQASLAPSAAGLAYGRGVAAWTVVRQLVEAGEQVAVIDFLRAMADKSVAEHDLLLAAAEDVRNGQLPARLFERV